jgi:hypothetical protein
MWKGYEWEPFVTGPPQRTMRAGTGPTPLQEQAPGLGKPPCPSGSRQGRIALRGPGADPLCISSLTLQALLAYDLVSPFLGFPGLRLILPLGARDIMAAPLHSVTLRSHHVLDGRFHYDSNEYLAKV